MRVDRRKQEENARRVKASRLSRDLIFGFFKLKKP
jgi:hypothetical protein